MKNILTTFALIACLGQLLAQDEFQYGGIHYTMNPAVNLTDPANDQLKDAEMDIAELRAFVMIPFRLKNEKTTILAGADYSFLGGPLNDLPGERNVNADLHAVTISAGINHKFSDQWAMRLMLRPTIASDFSGSLTSDAFTLQGSAVIRRISESGWRYGLGAAYTNGFGEPTLVPIGELMYKSENFDMVLIAPVQLAVRYHFDQLMVGFRVDLQGNEYALNPEDDQKNVAEIEGVRFSRYNVGPTVAYTISDKLRFQISGGMSLKRTLTAIDVNGEELDYDLENGAYFKAGIILGQF